MPATIIVHGGSGDIPLPLHTGHLDGCRAAANAGWEVLARGGPALDAIEAAIRIMEAHPDMDAGRGSYLNRDGFVELDAGMMDGETLRAGSVAAVRRVANPISLARRVLHDSPHVFLVGEGAEQFAVEMGLPLCDPNDLIVEREREHWRQKRAGSPETGRAEFQASTGAGTSDTVGAVALDSAGNLAAGNSTGGMFFKHPGRVGDTPIIGCGLYADDSLGAAVCTGWGEQIMKTVLAKTTVDQMALLGSAQNAAAVAMAYFQHRVGGLGGVICVSPRGDIGFAHSAPHMAHAYRTEAMTEASVAIRAAVVTVLPAAPQAESER